MSPLRLTGSTSGYSQIDAPAVAGDQTFTLPGTGGTLDRLNRAGNILQVVNGSYSTQVSTTTNAWVDTGLSASITPSTSSSKILILVNQTGLLKNSSSSAYIGLQLLRGSTSIVLFEDIAGFGVTTNLAVGASSVCYLDSPATTSAITYKTQFRSSGNAATVWVQAIGSVSGASTITLLEVAA